MSQEKNLFFAIFFLTGAFLEKCIVQLSKCYTLYGGTHDRSNLIILK